MNISPEPDIYIDQPPKAQYHHSCNQSQPQPDIALKG